MEHSRYIIQNTYHNHSHYCDGKDSLEAMIQRAIFLGFKSFGFSSHAAVPFENPWSIVSMEAFDNYIADINCLKKKYSKDIQLFRGLEADYIPDISYSFEMFRKRGNLDYIIGGVHLVKNPENEKLWFIDGAVELFGKGLKEVFQLDYKKAVTLYFRQINEMIEKESPEIIAHFDKIRMNNQNRFFHTDENWYKKLFMESLDLIAERNVFLEVNTRGVYKKKCSDFFPESQILRVAKEKNISIIISADAHQKAEINAGFELAVERIKAIGYREIMVLSQDKKWETEAI